MNFRDARTWLARRFLATAGLKVRYSRGSRSWDVVLAPARNDSAMTPEDGVHRMYDDLDWIGLIDELPAGEPELADRIETDEGRVYEVLGPLFEYTDQPRNKVVRIYTKLVA